MYHFSEAQVRAMQSTGRAILLAPLRDGENWIVPGTGAQVLGLLEPTLNFLDPRRSIMTAVVELPRRVRDLGRNAALRIPDPPADHPCAGGCSCMETRRNA